MVSWALVISGVRFAFITASTKSWELHFDNTGIYALLKRRLPLMVLADCGADPRYVFDDVENLVRKARIDYNADIEFIDPQSLPCTLQQEPLRELWLPAGRN